MLRSEFRRRLVRLERAIFASIGHDAVSVDLFPALFSVISYMWCRTYKDLLGYAREKPTVDF